MGLSLCSVWLQGRETKRVRDVSFVSVRLPFPLGSFIFCVDLAIFAYILSVYTISKGNV